MKSKKRIAVIRSINCIWPLIFCLYFQRCTDGSFVSSLSWIDSASIKNRPLQFSYILEKFVNGNLQLIFWSCHLQNWIKKITETLSYCRSLCISSNKQKRNSLKYNYFSVPCVHVFISFLCLQNVYIAKISKFILSYRTIPFFIKIKAKKRKRCNRLVYTYNCNLYIRNFVYTLNRLYDMLKNHDK